MHERRFVPEVARLLTFLRSSPTHERPYKAAAMLLCGLWWLGAAPRVKIERFSKDGWEAAVAAGGKFPAWQAAVLAGEKFRPCVGKGATTDEWCGRMVKEPPGQCPGSAPSAPQAVPGSSGWPGAPREGAGPATALGAPSCFKAADVPPLTIQVRPQLQLDPTQLQLRAVQVLQVGRLREPQRVQPDQLVVHDAARMRHQWAASLQLQ